MYNMPTPNRMLRICLRNGTKCSIKVLCGSLLVSLCLLIYGLIFEFPVNVLFGSKVNSSYGYSQPGVQYALTTSRDYILNNENICPRDRRVTALVLVHTAAQHFSQRQNIRSTYGSTKLFLPAEVRVVFLIGLVMDVRVQEQIQMEHLKYGDTIQGNFVDTYYNLTHKAVMGLRWVTENCRNVRYVVKVDDDALFDMWKFLNYYCALNTTHNIYCGVVSNGTIFRSGKWAVSSDEFQGMKTWPWKYCPGFVVIMTGDIIPVLYVAAKVTPFLWIDDVYTYGYLRHQAGNIPISDMPNTLKLVPEEIGGICLIRHKGNCPYLAVSADQSIFNYLWKIMKMRKINTV